VNRLVEVSNASGEEVPSLLLVTFILSFAELDELWDSKLFLPSSEFMSALPLCAISFEASELLFLNRFEL